VPALSPEDALTAIYPVDTLASQYPLVELVWSDTARERREMMSRFRTWLNGAEGKRALNDVGLRPPQWNVGDPLTDRFGALDGVNYVQGVVADRALHEARAARVTAGRPGRVLVMLDGSGSMNRTATGQAESRFTVASQAVTRLSTSMSAHDALGLSVFSGAGGRPRSLLPVKAGTGRAPEVARALSTVRPRGDTPLYRAIVDGVTSLGPGDRERETALVVITDGEDFGSDVNADQLLDSVRDKGVRVFVVAVGEARCATGVLRSVTDATGGDCLATGFGNLDAQLDTLFGLLWKGTTR
jgi:Mg-chelatase subunit ChlD